MDNYRIKVCVNFNNISFYDDNITDKKIINLINFIFDLTKDDKKEFEYMCIQKSINNFKNKFGIYLVCSKNKNILTHDKLCNDIYKNAKNKYIIEVFGYKYRDSEIKYITDNTRLKNDYDKPWHTNMNSFVQCNPHARQEIHSNINLIINSIMKKNNYNYLGIGGESGYYALCNDVHFNNVTCLTNSKYIFDDNKYNMTNMKNTNNYLVNYNDLDVSKYVDIKKECVLLINISRKGLMDLAYEIIKFPFVHIIYIGCCEKSVNRDMMILSEKYNICNYKIVKLMPSTNYNGHIIELTRKNIDI